MSSIFWIDGPWPGKLGISARPRGGDWLEDDLRRWQAAGVNAVVSLLEREEATELELIREGNRAREIGLKTIACPIPDRGIPDRDGRIGRTLQRIENYLSSGLNVIVHCRQGVGRSALVAAALLVSKGITAEEALSRISRSRGLPVPETPEQRKWITDYAEKYAGMAVSH